MVEDPSQPLNLPPKQKRSVKIGEASKILGLHKDTLRRWEKSGKITPVRTPGGTRLYPLDELSSLIPKVLGNFSKPASAKPLHTKKISRIVKEGMYAHIYNKGVEKRIIFNDEEDYKIFLGFLKDYLTAPKDLSSIKKTFQVHGRTFQGIPHQPKNYFNQVELIAYSLMPDHFHLLLHQVTKGSIEKFVRSLCTRYSMYFNKKYERTGALFEGPYKSVQVKNELRMLYLTRYLHQTKGYSSYPEYLGARETFWVKPKAVFSFFGKGTRDYKIFVEKYELDQKEKEFLEGITFEGETNHLQRRDFTSNEEIHPDPGLELRSNIPHFLAISAAVFVLLVTVGTGNIILSKTESSQPLPTPASPDSGQIQSGPTPAVLSEKEEVSTAPADAVKPKVILKVKIDDESSSVNIRQKPTTDSEKIGKARDGDTFEFVSLHSGWYEVKLEGGSTGFISATYIEMEERNN